MKIIVCGGRKYENKLAVYYVLDSVHANQPISLIIEGGALGADRQARGWAIEHKIPYVTEEADWDRHGKRAGPIRNRTMLEKHKPAGVIAFPGGMGTAAMIEQARHARITVYEPF